MELDWLCYISATLLGAYLFVFKCLRNVNGWYYHVKLGKKKHPLPPGDMGWPLVGNFFAFAKSFRSGDPDSFINKLVSRYGRTGIYKTHLFGNPSVIVCTPDMCRRVMTDEEHFRPGYPKSTVKLTGTSAGSASPAEHKRLRRLTTAPIMGHKALAVYTERIEDIVIDKLDEWASMKQPFELLKGLKEVTFRVIIHIFFGSHSQYSVVTKIGELFTETASALFSLPIDLPGFTFHKALKARKKLVGIIECILEERKMMMKTGDQREGKKDLVDVLLEVEDENGEKLEDKDIVDLLFQFQFAGHESTSLGYTIPKGWKVVNLIRAIHMDPQYYPNAQEFNPSRWDDYKVKTGSFLPFGIGCRLCPGSDLAKLEITIFLHYFLRNYKLERINEKCPITFLPMVKPTDDCLARVIKVP
ncbi:hypothetical protein L6164_019736 [Bauhinia variegata]|uniref:Uncharacterized protein n=1 Tax=Bauhinia variegata TaxID=167791 RepID=A0ACB9MSR1_BAUVA|nr:hypothetical protein L6164_019736 [Bauhinia variegata]